MASIPRGFLSRPFCTTALYSSPTPDQQRKVVDGLVSIFTKQPFSPENAELTALGSSLTTHIVEAVLKRLNSWQIANAFFSWASDQSGYRHNCYTYNAMAYILSSARQNAPMKSLVADMVKSRCSMSPGALGFLLRCLGRQEMGEEANELFDQVRELGLCASNSYSYNCLLEAICRSCNPEKITMRLDEMRGLGWEPDKYTLTPLLKCYCDNGKYDPAMDVFKLIMDRGLVDGHVLSILTVAFSKWRKVDEAFELVESLEDHNIKLNEKTFYVLIHGFVDASRVDRAHQMYSKMRKLGFTPDLSVFDVLIRGLSKDREMDKLLCLYSEMKELGVYPDVRILTKLILSFSEVGDMIRLLEEGQEYLDAKNMTLAYNRVLDDLVCNNSFDKAYQLVQATLASGFVGVDKLIQGKKIQWLDSTSFGIVIDGLCRSNKFELALNLFQDMTQFGYKKNVLVFNNMIHGLCMLDRLEEGHQLLGEMKNSGLKPTQFTYNSIFGCLCRRGDVEDGIKMMREMRTYGHQPWIKHYTMLVKQLGEHGRAEEAGNFLAEMVKEGFVPDVIAYSAAMIGFVEIKQVNKAVELFRDICLRGCCPDVVSYNILIDALCKERRLPEAHGMLTEMLAKGLVPSVVTYNMLIDAWCKNGNIDEAMLCLSKMVEKEREPNIITYTTLIVGLCNARRPDEALVLWGRIPPVPNRIAFMALIDGLCKCERADAALIYFEEMENLDMKPDSYIYVALIGALLSKLNYLGAFDILERMIQKGKTPAPHEKSYSIVRDAVLRLSKNARTSSGIKNLIGEGNLSMASLSEV